MTPLISGPRSGSLFGARNIGADAQPLGRLFCARSGRSPTARALLIALVVALAFVSPAEATRKRPADLKSQAAQTLVPNGERDITPGWWNAFVADMIDSGIPYFASESNCYWKANGPNAPASCEALTLGDATIDAGKIASGTINVARMPGNVARTDTAQSFTGVKTFAATPIFSTLASGYLKTNVSGAPVASPTIPAADISGLAPSATLDTTNAANISQGVFDPARLPSVVMRTNTAQVISGQKTFPTPPVFPSLSGYLKGNGPGQMTSVPGIPAADVDGVLTTVNIPILDVNAKTSGVLGSSRGGAGSVLGLLKADGGGGVSSANLLDFTGDAYSWQYPNIDHTGVTDSRAGIQAMIDAVNTLSPVQKRGAKIVFGPGRFKLSGPIIPGGGQTIQGASQYLTTFVVDSAAFDMNSVGVLQLPFGDSTAIYDIGFFFEQPNTPGMTRSDLIKYPPAIVGQTNSTRPIIDRVRVVNGYGCMHLVGNVGGANIGEVGCSTLAKYSYANFTASASGTTLSVPAIATGSIEVPGNIYRKSGVQLTLYRVVSQLTGTPGSTGDYQLGAAATFGSSNMYQTQGGFVVDGAKDFVRIGRINCVSGLGTTLYPNLNNVYMDRQTNCATFGEVDGLSVGTISPYAGNIRVTPRAGLLLPYIMGPLQLDVDNADVIVYAGSVRIRGGYSTKSAAQTTPIIEANGLNSRVSVEDFVSQIDDSQSCAFKASGGGQLTLRGGLFAHSHTASNLGCAVGDYSTIAVIASRLAMGNVNRTAAFFFSGATSFMQLIANHKDNESPGLTGHAFEMLGDQTNNIVKGSCFQNRTHNLPFNTSLGHYDLCESDTVSTPSIAFVTPGSAITVNSSAGKYWRKGDHVEFELALDFKTPVATSEAGELRIAGTGVPKPRTGSETGCQWDDAQKLVFGGPVFPIIDDTPTIKFRELVSGGASALLGPTGFPQNTDHFIAKFHCRYPVQ